jgi:hypothetical protein
MAKRVVRPIPRSAEFVFEVRPPSWSYDFSLQLEKSRDDPFDERQALQFTAPCLYPDRFKGREAQVRLYGQRNLVEADRQQRPKVPPNGVASILATKAKFELWAHLPSDACWQIGAAMAAGTVRYMLANAPVFAPKHSFVNSLSFEGPGFDALGYIG